MTEKTLLEFPCEFPVKVIGLKTETFVKEIKDIAITHFPELNPDTLVQKPSKKENYIALTIIVTAQSQAMLDDFYKELTAHPQVKMVL